MSPTRVNEPKFYLYKTTIKSVILCYALFYHRRSTEHVQKNINLYLKQNI